MNNRWVVPNNMMHQSKIWTMFCCLQIKMTATWTTKKTFVLQLQTHNRENAWGASPMQGVKSHRTKWCTWLQQPWVHYVHVLNQTFSSYAPAITFHMFQSPTNFDIPLMIHSRGEHSTMENLYKLAIACGRWSISGNWKYQARVHRPGTCHAALSLVV